MLLGTINLSIYFSSIRIILSLKNKKLDENQKQYLITYRITTIVEQRISS